MFFSFWHSPHMYAIAPNGSCPVQFMSHWPHADAEVLSPDTTSWPSCQLFTILPVYVFRNVPATRGCLIVKRILFTTVTIHSAVPVCPLHYSNFEISRD